VPNILALSTSSPVLSVALKKGNDTILEETVPGFMKHAENLIPKMDLLLKKKKLSISKVDTLLIDRGPGSFTGLRIGFATLKGLLVSQKRKCLGILSLDLIAENIDLPEDSALAVCLDAYRQKIYTRLYKRVQNHWKPFAKPVVVSAEELGKLLPEEIHLTGDAIVRYKAEIEKATVGKKLHFVAEKKAYPKASRLISIYMRGNTGSTTLQTLNKPAEFIPLYFRLSEAEERRNTHLNRRPNAPSC
jgi:tRNA threonylcarbamoyladenosine biosynthesis protein TsaB